MTSPTLVTLVLDGAAPGGGSPLPALTSGYAEFTPGSQLTAPAYLGAGWVPPGPVQAQFRATGAPSVTLLATDDPNVLPSGWQWKASFHGVSGSPAGFSFLLPAGPAVTTMTNASPAVFTWTPTTALTVLFNGCGITLAGSFPGFTAGTQYYVTGLSGTTFSLAATQGGTAMPSTGTGSGTLTVTQYSLSMLATVPAASPASVAFPVPSGTPVAGNLPFATGSGEASAWRAIQASDVPPIAESQVTGLVADLAAKAPLASPVFTGTPAAPTATSGTNTTQVATTAFAAAAAAAAQAAAEAASVPLADYTALGDTLYGTGAGTVAKLPGNTSATRKFARQQGTGSVSAAPVWDTLQAGDIPPLAYAAVVQPSGDVTGVTDAANVNSAVAALPSKGGVVRLASTGRWYVECGQVSVNGSGIFIDGTGCFISAVGTGDVFRMQDTGSGGTWTVFGGGILGNPVIDGTSAGAGSAGVHLGDLFQARCDVSVQNFTGTGSIGVHFDNASYWTEQLKARVFAKNCTQHVVFDVTGASTSTASFARPSLEIYVDQVTASNDGLVLQNGAVIYDSSSFSYGGNFTGSSSSLTSCAARITGTVPAGHPGAGNYAGIADSRLDWGLECASGTHTPTTIICGSTSNKIVGCYGIMDFGGQDSPANFTAAARIGIIFPFSGPVFGDSVLVGASGYPSGVTWGAPSSIYLGDFTSATVLASSGTISTYPVKGVVRVTTTANVTGVILETGSFDGQVVAVVNETAFTITFAASGTSHVADGTSDVIPAQCARMYVFDGADTNLWYRCA